ncbi:MAG TPA: SRPBCC family protein [Candidatus Xenobia bacterium]|jgi:uncharacterized protein YndB with AHSA1/START domain
MTDRIEKTILLKAPRARVWRAITDPAEFGHWFGIQFDGPFTPGRTCHGTVVGTKANAEVAEKQKNHEDLKCTMIIDRVEPERFFSLRWHPNATDPKVDYSKEPTTLVAFVLDEVPEGIQLTLTESGFDGIPLERRAQAFASNSGGWNIILPVLGEYVARS